MSEDELFKTADAWAEILENVEPERIERAYKIVISDRRDRGPLQPQELLRVARSLGREKPTAAPPPREQAGTVTCLACDGIGYQIVVEKRYGREYTSARPCCCMAAPASQRSAYPLAEPEYHRDARGYWRHAPSMFGADREAG